MAKQNQSNRDMFSDQRDILQTELNLTQQIISAVKTNKSLSNDGIELKKKLIDKMAEESDISSKISEINSTITELLKEQVKTGTKVNQHYINQLNATSKLLQKEKAIAEAKGQFRDTLKDAVGLNNKYVDAFKKGGAAALGWMTATKAVEYISSTLGSIVTDGYHLYKELGIGADEAFRLSTNAFTSLENFGSLLIYGEGFSSSAREAAEYYGRTAEVTGDMQRNMATLKKLGVDSTKAVQLDKIFSDAAGDGNDLTDSIKVIAKKEGVTAKKLFEGMADDMSRLVGATEDEIMAMAKTNAQLIKRGFTMKQLEDISNNVLSVEQSMRAEAKARAFIGRDINANGVRQAALALQTATTEEGRNAAMLDMSRILEQQVGSAEDFNNMSIKQRQLFAEAYGMSVDGITEMLTKQEKFNEYQKEYNGLSDEDILNKIEADEKQQAILTGIIDSGKEMGSLSMAMIPALASAKELGVNFGGVGDKLKGVAKGAGNLLKKLYEMTAGKLLGKLGGIGETLGGGGKGPKTPKTPKMPKGGGKSMSGITGAIEKIDAKKLLAGGAALVLVAASVFIFAKAVQEFTEVGWKEVGMAIVSMVALVGALALVGTIMSSGVGAVAILAGAAAMVVIAGAMYILGKATQQFVPIVETLGEIFIGVLGVIPPIIDSIANGFATMFSSVTMDNIGALLLLGPALMGVAAGLGAVGLLGIPGMLVLTGLSAIAPSLIEMATSVKDLFGFDSEQSDTETESKESNTMGELLSEIKGLRQDLQAQPIMVNVDGKVVSRISRVQNRQSVSKNGYGG